LKNKPVVTTDCQLKDTQQLASPAEEEQPPIPSLGTSLQLIDDDDCDQQTIDGQNTQLMCYLQYQLEDILRDTNNLLPVIMILYNIKLQAKTSSWRREIV